MIIDSPIISGSYAASGSLNQLGNVVISGSLTVTGSIIGTASFAETASYLSGYVSPFPFTGSAIISGSLEVTGSANIPNITGSLSGSLNGTASYAVTASNAVTASYLTGYVSPFPFTGSAIISGSLGVSGSLQVTNLSGSGVRYLVADESGSVTAQSASAALKSTEAFTSTAGQTTFSVTNGYSTGYVDVFINGSKLSTTEFTDTSGTNIVLATGSFSGDVVEVVKYTPAAGVTNNVLRQLTTLTGSAGQTVFSASYTPGLLDIFYNGSRLSTSDYTANNGTFFTLATGSVDGDILDILVYSYQVGAFNGIGGQGVVNQLAFFNTTSSITGSPNFTISGSTMTVTGSLIVSGSGTFTNIGPAVFSGSLTSTAGFTGSFSGTATSASYAANADLLDGLDSTVFAITGSNTFTGIQTINSNLIVTGSITAQTLVVQTITSSVDFVTGSTRFGSILGNTHVFSGSVTMNPGGLFVSSSGLVGIGTTSPLSKFDISVGNQTSLGLFSASGTSITSAGGSTGNLYQIAFGYGGGAYAHSTIAGLTESNTGYNTGALIFATRALTTDTAPIERMRISSVETTFNYNPQSGSLLSGYNYLNFGGGSIMYRNTTDLYIGSNAKYGSAGTTVANYTSANGMGMLTMDGGTLNYQSTTGSVTAGTAYGMPIRMTITPAGYVGIGTNNPSYLFHVVGSATGNGALVYSGNSSSNYSFVVGDYATNTNFHIRGDGYAYMRNFLGIGEGTPTAKLHISVPGSVGSTIFTRIERQGGYGSFDTYLNYESTYFANGNTADFRLNGISYLKFAINNPSTEYRILSRGFLKASNDGTYYDAAGGYHEIKSNVSDNTMIMWNSSATPSGLFINYTAAPNATNCQFLRCFDGNVATERASIRSNGGLANYSGNNVNLASDRRLKKDISPLSTEWDKLKQIEVVNFKYKDSTDETALYGAIAQQVQEVYPNLVIVTREATETEPEYYGLREQPFQWLTTKVLQEAMAKIEEQQALITALQEKLERNNIN
jgi:hypothetical protein